uniref:Uncharacterized protein n=1 Tax=Panagrolaimus davidi TaxID=227884 RepID=A0A914PNU9_9BILA
MPQTISIILCILFILFLPNTLAAEDGDINKATEDGKDNVALIFNSLIATFVISTIISTGTCILLWHTFFYTYANFYRIMWSLEEKLRIATRRLSDRKLGDNIMEQLKQMAPYDAARNKHEISTMLKSVYKK